MALIKRAILDLGEIASGTFEVQSSLALSANENNTELGKYYKTYLHKDYKTRQGQTWYFLPRDYIDNSGEDFEIYTIGFDKYDVGIGDFIYYNAIKKVDDVVYVRDEWDIWRKYGEQYVYGDTNYLVRADFSAGAEIYKTFGDYRGTPFGEWFVKNASRIRKTEINIKIYNIHNEIAFEGTNIGVKPLRVTEEGLCDFDGNLIYKFGVYPDYPGLKIDFGQYRNGSIIANSIDIDSITLREDFVYDADLGRYNDAPFYTSRDTTKTGLFGMKRGSTYYYANSVVIKNGNVSLGGNMSVYNIDYFDNYISVGQGSVPKDVKKIPPFSVVTESGFEKSLTAEEAYKNELVLHTSDKLTEENIIVKNNIAGKTVVTYGENEIEVNGNENFSLDTKNKSFKEDIKISAKEEESVPRITVNNSTSEPNDIVIEAGGSRWASVPEDVYERIAGFNIFINGLYYKTVFAEEVEE